MSIEAIIKFKKQISKVLHEASTSLSYNGCNDIPDSFWEGLTEKDKCFLINEAVMEGLIDKDSGTWIADSTVAELFSKWFKELESESDSVENWLKHFDY